MCREFCGRLTIFLRMRRSTLSGKCWILAGHLDMRFTTSTGLAMSSCWLSCGLFRIRFGCGCRAWSGRFARVKESITTECTGVHGDAQGRPSQNQLEADAAFVLAGAGAVVSSGAEPPSMCGPGVVTGEAGIPLI